MNLTYPVTIEAEHADGLLFVRSRDFPELLTYGETVVEAALMAADALMTCIEHRAAHHEPIPAPTRRREGEYHIMPTWVSAKASPEERLKIAELLKPSSNLWEKT